MANHASCVPMLNLSLHWDQNDEGMEKNSSLNEKTRQLSMLNLEYFLPNLFLQTFKLPDQCKSPNLWDFWQHMI